MDDRRVCPQHCAEVDGEARKSSMGMCGNLSFVLYLTTDVLQKSRRSFSAVGQWTSGKD